MNSTTEQLFHHSRLIRATLTRTVLRAVFLSMTSLLCASVPWATAAPLPNGTKLSITQFTGGPFTADDSGCATGSCFGMYLFSGLYAWTPILPGTDGGIIIGEGQLSGGQEVAGLSARDGEVTAVWEYGRNYGTFFTTPSDAGNVFDNASCTGSGCGSNTTPKITALAVWNTAWGGQTIPMGSAAGCNKTLLPSCTDDQVAGIFVKSWTVTGNVFELKYNQTVPAIFTNYPYELILRGTIEICDPCAKLVPDPDTNYVAPNTLVKLVGTCWTTTGTITGCSITQTDGPTTAITNTLAPIPGFASATRNDTFMPTLKGAYVFTLTAEDSTPPFAHNTRSTTITVSTDSATFPQASTDEGCSMVQGATVNPSERFDWWLVLGFIAWLGMIVRRRQQVLV